ncbi:MAG: TM0996/MTH895 family glutaredoxin-like protein [Haliscomenobacter sp.]|nr:TM0996/MTH895 family glutaredoxin-like protein [Haliscomenobacter sp.]
MKTIKILGTGCPKCRQTEAIVRQAVEEKGLPIAIEKVEDIMAIMAYQVLSTPAVVIDEEVKINGRVPSLSEVMELFKSSLIWGLYGMEKRSNGSGMDSRFVWGGIFSSG